MSAPPPLTYPSLLPPPPPGVWSQHAHPYMCLYAPACLSFLRWGCPSQHCTLFFLCLPGIWHLQQEGG